MKNFFTVACFLFLGVFILGGFIYSQSNKDSFMREKVLSVEETDVKDSPTVTKTGVPMKLSIPVIAVDAVVESVGLDKDGNMDVPKRSENVAWYNLGYLAGEKGNTVIAGHLDTESGAPAVFYRLKELKSGDMLYVEDQNSLLFAYKVTEVREYPYDHFPLKEVFGGYNKNRLNLITCQGVYNSAKRVYSHRTVVFSELVNISN